MSQRDFDKWETLYAKPDDAPPRSPESFALRCAKTVSPGHAVDIAGGTGRHARALIELGWKVTLIDIAPSALKRARASLGANADKLKTVAVDLEQTTEALSPATFDLVLCAWFLPQQALWQAMVSALAPDGHLIYIQPTHGNLVRHARPSARFLLPDGRLESLFEELGLKMRTYEEGWDDRGHHTARGFAQKAS